MKLPLNIVRAKNQVVLNEAFYSVLLMGMSTMVDEHFHAPMGTDGKSIRINPQIIEDLKWDNSQTQFVFCHECVHVMSGDMWWAREMGLDPQLANEAQDHWINLQLLSENKSMPKQGLADPKYKGWTKLQIYKDLQANGGGGGGGGKGKGKDPMGKDVIETNEPIDALKAEIGLRVKQAVQAAKSVGAPVPSWAEDMISELSKPKINWKRRLHHLLQTIVYSHNDWSYRRMNRRYIPHSIIAPSLWSPEPAAGCIVVAVDTSGSIAFDELQQFWSEIREILTELSPRVLHVLDVDTDIRKHRSFSPHDPLPDQIQVYGRGGTTFTEPFRWVEENLRDDRPQALVYLTDMYGIFPANRPDYPVIWCATTPHEAPFPETIHLPVEE